jgi:hypothetical protein
MPENTTNTRFKLNEASYFLDQMKKTRGNETIFFYYLDAFIVSARSILWVLNHEYSHKKGFTIWHDSQDLNLPKETLDLFNSRRIVITHREGNVTAELRKRVSRTMVFTYDIEPEFSPYAARATAVTHASPAVEPETLAYAAPATATARFAQTKETKFTKTNSDEWHFKDADESAVETCQRYYFALSGIVHKCESEFGNS